MNLPTLCVTRRHDLDYQRAREAIQQLADELATKLAADYRWNGNRLVFENKSASGHIELAEGRVDVEIRLGLLMAPLRATIESSIEQYLDERLN